MIKKTTNKNIGLRRGVVSLAKHNAKWKNLFEREKRLLLKKFPNIILEIEHGGSTAIPNIPAKPIIDIFVAVKSLKNLDKIKSSLEKLGYEYHGSDGVNGRILYTKGSPKITTHHLHFVERKGNEWKNNNLIKNYFLEHPEVAREYADLKIKLAKEYPNDRKSYTSGKDTFIKSIIRKANAK
jgi:GrpB-like predicted nucleotidyltransferase (UPF0157 family)